MHFLHKTSINNIKNYTIMRNFTIFRTGSQRGVNTFMSGEGAIEHPMSTHSAPFGTSWKARGWRYIASILMFLMLSIGNVWAINWVEYGCKPQTGGQYYLRSDDPTNSTGFFFNTPTIASGSNIYINGTSSSDAILFTVGTVTADGDNLSLTEISFQSGNTKYSLWPKVSSTKGGVWLSRTTMVPYTATLAQENTYPNKSYKSAYYLYGGHNSLTTTANKDTVLMPISRKVPSTNSTYNYAQLSGSLSLSSAGKKVAWLFISPEAYEDATGTQYHYTVEAQVYTNGAASSTGGSMKMAPRTYKKPAVADWTYPGDYVDAIDQKVKGGLGGFAVVNIYCKVTPTSGYNFIGFKDASNTALEKSSEKGTYTYLPNTYELVDDMNGIYRVSLRVNSADTDHPTEYKLRACFAQPSDPVVYEYNPNNEKIAEYTNLSTAFSTAAAGSRIELRKDISNVSSAFTIAKSLTLDFNNHTITGTADILLQITNGNVTFVDNSTSGVGGITTGGDVAISVSGGSLTINDGKYIADKYAVEQHTGSSVTIKNGGFESNGTQDINGAITLNGGFFYNNGGLNVISDYAVVTDIPTGMKYTTKDYRYMVVKKTSSNYPRCVVISENTETPKDTKRINFNSLEGAIAYVNNNANDDRVKTIIMRENCTLNGGKYTIPQYTTLVIPYSADQSMAHPHVELEKDDNEPEGAYRTLTLQNGAHIDIYGALEIGGKMTGGASAAQGELGIARPSAPRYGLLTMGSGTSITLCDNASLNAWGFVQGAGTIDVRRGATIREMFQINDWKGYSATTAMVRSSSVDYTYKVLPVNQYFIQNVEVKTTYRPGSRLLGQVTVKLENLPNPVGFNDVGIIGVKYSAAEKAAYAEKNPGKELKDDVAIFLMDNEDTSEDTWVCKSYDVANDIQLYEVNNSAHLGSLLMTIDMTDIHSSLYIDADSREFVLPITNNFKIHLLYGNLYVTQDTELLPGAEIKINKKGTLTINQNWDETKQKWIPQTLYLYDKDQWGTYVYKNKEGDGYNFGYASRIRYRHGGLVKERTLTPEGLGDAKLTVHGTVDVQGYLKTTQGDWYAVPNQQTTVQNQGKPNEYTTKTLLRTCTATELVEKTEGGASITSTIADAGTIILSRKTGNVGTTGVSNYLWQVNSIGGYIDKEPDYYGNHVEPALLKNANGTYTSTEDKSEGNSFCYIDFNGVGTWKMLTNDGCFVYDEKNVCYAKPKDYVALRNGKTAEDDHTYKSADGSRTFILVDDCQWWEVEPVAGHPDLFECKHPDNRIVYYYDYEASKWKEKRHNVTWLTYGADTIEVYSLKHGVQPKYLGDIPTRAGDAYYTYDFIGWSPAITDQTIVTGDVTYTAQYERKDVMYTVTWKDLAGNIIESGYYKLGDAPTCTSEVDMTGKEWSPAVGAVTGNTIYQLITKNNDGPFTIKFVNWNWDGTDEQALKIQSVTKTNPLTAPTPPAAPEKDALADVAFEFAGWRAADNTVYAPNATLPGASENAIYTATFTEKPITYTITWKNGEIALDEQEVTPNTVPQYTGPTPTNGDEDYAFIGWTPTVVAATANATYTAVFELQNKTVDGETYTIPASTQQSLTTITITDDGKLVIPASSTLTVDNLILEATSNASGQLDASKNSSIVTVNAYFDLKLNTAARHWRAFGVPWAVNLNTNPLVEVETGRTLVLGRDYGVLYYDGIARATQGPGANCWADIEEHGGTLTPGQGYMIAFTSDVQTVRFAKTSGTPVIFTGSITAQAEGTGTDQGINAISNPMAYHANLSLTGVGQVHDGGEIGSDGYDPITISGLNYIVGQTVYVQVENEQTISVANSKISPAAAPARRAAKATDKKYMVLEDYYAVSLMNADGVGTKLYVLPEEDKEDKYVIGHDLVKMGMSTKKAQIWVRRYDANLGLNTTAPVDGIAEYPVKLYAPAAGEYTISNAYAPDEEYTVYLTREGEAIWNLSDSPYTLTLSNGTTNGYGIRLSAKSPQIATGIDEAVVDAKGETRKVIINDKVYIIRGENVYSVDGQLVK